MLALGLGIAINESRLDTQDLDLWGYDSSLASLFIGTFIFAHLVAVVFRSHANPGIFRAYPLRFTLVPIVLFTAMISSLWVTVAVSVVATFWDVYHSSLQTFGIGRIYDMRCGNGVEAGRSLDWYLNLLLYARPIAAGATLMDHIEDFEEFQEVGALLLVSIPARVEANSAYLTWAVLAFGTPFLIHYVWSYRRLHRQGYDVSLQKTALLASTGLCSIYNTWGFNSFGQAFFIMNFFHALQYFAIVWWSEKRNLVRLLRLERAKLGPVLALALLVGACFAYGLWAEAVVEDGWGLRLVLVVAVMHFWYDGFIWSVRKKQV